MISGREACGAVATSRAPQIEPSRGAKDKDKKRRDGTCKQQAARIIRSSANLILSMTRTNMGLCAGRASSLHKVGTGAIASNSPPSHRCPRHLHHTSNLRSCPGSGSDSGLKSASEASPKSPMQTRSANILGNNGKSRISGVVTVTGLASWKTGAGVGAGLASAGMEGTVLRRRTVVRHTTSHLTTEYVGPCSVGGRAFLMRLGRDEERDIGGTRGQLVLV
ncbi:hypothetical protein DFH11DRAFT_1809568 [Phellopilus nigrolimitatus]|nr:hypothetical protein DFH11DRAFT_1809568 [Phellopilus nigrolimitatus]